MLIEASRETRVVVPASAALPYQPESASAARQLVRNKLLNWELGELVDDALLVVSELVANAVRTGCQSKMLVTICRVTAQSVRITVWDGSRTLPCMIQAGRQRGVRPWAAPDPRDHPGALGRITEAARQGCPCRPHRQGQNFMRQLPPGRSHHPTLEALP